MSGSETAILKSKADIMMEKRIFVNRRNWRRCLNGSKGEKIDNDSGSHSERTQNNDSDKRKLCAIQVESDRMKNYLASRPGTFV